MWHIVYKERNTHISGRLYVWTWRLCSFRTTDSTNLSLVQFPLNNIKVTNGTCVFRCFDRVDIPHTLIVLHNPHKGLSVCNNANLHYPWLQNPANLRPFSLKHTIAWFMAAAGLPWRTVGKPVTWPTVPRVSSRAEGGGSSSSGSRSGSSSRGFM